MWEVEDTMYQKRIIEEKIFVDLIKNRNLCKSGFIKCWKGTSLNHWIVTCKVAHKLINSGWTVLSECEFYSGGRADLVALNGSTGVIYEIMESEKLENIKLKQNKYPKEFLIIPIRCKDFDYDTFEI